MSMKLLLCIVIDIIALTLQTLTIVFSLKNVNSLWFMNQINWMAIIYYILFLINFICNLCNKYSKSEKCYAECFMCIIRMLLFAFGPIYIPSSFFLMGKKPNHICNHKWICLLLYNGLNYIEYLFF